MHQVQLFVGLAMPLALHHQLELALGADVADRGPLHLHRSRPGVGHEHEHRPVADGSYPSRALGRGRIGLG